MSPFDSEHFEPSGIRGEGELHPEEIKNPDVDYDRTDMSAKAIVGFFIFLALAGLIMHLVLWGIYKNFAGSYKAQRPLAGPIESSTRQLPQGDPIRTFPPPQLQPDDVADMNKFLAQEEQTLNSYGWVNQNAGIVRIPIQRAIQVIAQEGLPTRQIPQRNAVAEQMEAPTPGSGGAMRQDIVNQPAGPPMHVASPH